MANIRIMTDSASDISWEELQSLQVGLIPMPILCGEEQFLDDRRVPMEVFWNKLIDGVTVKTSQPSPDFFLREFESAKAAGDAVICILISSKLSGTFEGALMAKAMADYEEIYLVDGGHAAASVAEKQLVLRACRLRDEGRLSAREIASELEALRSRIHLYACLDTLEYLARGGRLPWAVANIGTAIRIKPIITFSPIGDIHVVKKAIGGKRAMSEMVNIALQSELDPEYPFIPIYAQNDGNCRKNMEALQAHGFQTPMAPPEPIGATIGTYIGPGAYGIVFVTKD